MDTTATGDVYLDDKVTYKELEAIIDQKDHFSVDAMFTRWREQAVREVVQGVNEAFADKYIVRTVVDSKLIGTFSDRLRPIVADNVTRGVRFYRCNEWPSVAYRVTRVGFIGQRKSTMGCTTLNLERALAKYSQMPNCNHSD